MTALVYARRPPGVSSQPFGLLDDGSAATLYTLRNRQGLQVDISDLGGVIAALWTPDGKGNFDDIVLGFEQASDYLHNPGKLGAIVGRYAGRIGGAAFILDGKSYKLTANQGNNHLHGGALGFDRRLWAALPFTLSGLTGLRLRLQSPDGEEGFPGTLNIMVTYTLDDENRLTVDYQAVANQPTILNLTQHSYFNLGGHQAGDVLSHCLRIGAEAYLPLNDEMIPTGEIAPVAGTPFDFRGVKPIGQDMGMPVPQLQLAGGYDHCWVLARAKRPAPVAVAEVYHPASKRRLSLATDQPGLQFYTANGLEALGKGATAYYGRQGFCLETQNFPDAPNQPDFPTAVLKAGEDYASRTIFKFDIHS